MDAGLRPVSPMRWVWCISNLRHVSIGAAYGPPRDRRNVSESPMTQPQTKIRESAATPSQPVL